jgi:acyl carrier protein
VNDIYERVGAVLVNRCRVAADQLPPAATLEELGLDSMDYVTLAIALQKEFGVEVDDEELAPASSIADTVRLLESRLGLVRGDLA